MLAVFSKFPEAGRFGELYCSYHGARVTHVGDSQFVSINDKGRIGEVIRNWPRIDEARISVVTDGEQHRNGKIGHASLT